MQIPPQGKWMVLKHNNYIPKIVVRFISWTSTSFSQHGYEKSPIKAGEVLVLLGMFNKYV